MTDGTSAPEIKTSKNPQTQEKVEVKKQELKALKRFDKTSEQELNDRARSQVANEIWLERTREKLKEESEIDELTKLPNLKAFNKKLEEESQRVNRYKGNVSIVVLDVNNLKNINDNKGHEEGNEYLRSVAEALNEGKRVVDFAFRLHGDEFALILPETDIDKVKQMWEKTLNPKFKEKGIFICAGVSQLDQNILPKDTFKTADRAMYGAKKRSKETNENILESYVLEKL